MDEVTSQSTHDSPLPLPVSVRARLHRITPLSKYLALVLFIAMPFLGAYVGYHTAQSNQILNTPVQVLYSNTATSTENQIKEYSSVIDNARLTVDLRPLIEAELMFTVTAQNLPTVDLLNEMLVFRPESGSVVLENYHSGEIDDELLKVTTYTAGEDLEPIIERMTLESIAEASKITIEEADQLHVEYFSSIIDTQAVPSDTTFARLCELTTRTFKDKTIYALDYTGEFGKADWGYLCGSGGFQVFDGVIVGNFAVPSDAMEPKTIPFHDVRLIKQ